MRALLLVTSIAVLSAGCRSQTAGAEVPSGASCDVISEASLEKEAAAKQVWLNAQLARGATNFQLQGSVVCSW